MKNICRSKEDDKALLSSVIAAKGPPIRDALAAISTVVQTAYDAYLETAPALESLAPLDLSDSNRDALRHCYNSPTAEFKRVRVRLRDRPIEEMGECPYCRIGEPETLDHYLPKSQFAEFSIFTANLVPICGRCNLTKLERYKDAIGRVVVHPYFDPVGAEPFLFANVEFADGKPSIQYRVAQPRSMSDQVFRIIENHFTCLSLGERYLKRAVGIVDRLVKSLRDSDLSDNDKLDQCRRMADEQQRIRGPNHWETALYVGFLATTEIKGITSLVRWASRLDNDTGGGYG